jgi:hypothetical protein
MAESPKSHPYKKLEGSVLWRDIEKAIAALAHNGDIKELTARKYIVGLACQTILASKN